MESAGCSDVMEKWLGGREKERERGKSEMLQVMKGESERKERERGRERVYLQRYPITADGINFSVVPYFLR